MPQASHQRQIARDVSAGPTPTGTPSAAAIPSDSPEADGLTAKLQALAKLRRPEMSAQGNSSGAAMPAENDGAAFGFDNMYQVRDFLRAQVMRRWHLNVAGLGHDRVSVPIRVQITKRGEVLEVERARHQGTNLSLCFMKLEFEKPKNGDDNPAKEQMICTLGDSISREIRNWHTLSRYGLQTYALLMPQTTQSEARQFCNRLKQMSENNYADNDDVRIKFTFGLAEFAPEQNETGSGVM